ncbi:MAG: hypothetical protein FWG65_10240 [Turicibacter sp.]|nr:hypothetical protein [Turicibacter sp.]
MEYVVPEYEVTIGSSFWAVIRKRERDMIEYAPVIEIPIIKELGLARTMAEVEIYASGIIFDYLNRTSGAEISLKAVALPTDLLIDLEGETDADGFVISKTTNVAKEFAFGYWSENSDGSYVYFWHPVCKLVPADENRRTRTNNIPEPDAAYKIKIMPFNDIWRVKYLTNRADGAVLSREEFFRTPIFSETNLPVAAVPEIPVVPETPEISETPPVDVDVEDGDLGNEGESDD